jgi:hypothetical protein
VYLYYAEIAISQLKFGVNRPQSWWDQRPNAVKMKNDLKESIEKEGIRNPLSVRENDKGYVVEVGNQRLQVLKELGIQKVPCVINTKSKKDLEEIPSTKELKKYFKDGFEPFKDLGHIQPSNYKQWDGEVVYGR